MQRAKSIILATIGVFAVIGLTTAIRNGTDLANFDFDPSPVFLEAVDTAVALTLTNAALTPPATETPSTTRTPSHMPTNTATPTFTLTRTLTPSATRTPRPTTTLVVMCPGALPPRLIVGNQGRVTPGDPNNLRAAPSLGADRIGRIPPGATFLVLAGTECHDGYAWWQIDYNGMIGWAAEGDNSDYWIEPYRGSSSSSSTSSIRCGQEVAQQFQVVWPQLRDVLGCPEHLTNTTLFAYQDFQHGKLIWRGFELDDNNVIPHTDGTALALYNDDGTWQLLQFAKYDPDDDPVYPCPELGSSTSPLTPARGFGKLLCNMSRVRTRLGSAVAAEHGYPIAFVQEFSRGFLIHYHRQNDMWQTLAFFYGADSKSGTWEQF